VISALMGRALRHVADVLNNLDTGRNTPSYFIHSTNTSRTYHLTTCRWRAWGKSMWQCVWHRWAFLAVGAILKQCTHIIMIASAMQRYCRRTSSWDGVHHPPSPREVRCSPPFSWYVVRSQDFLKIYQCMCESVGFPKSWLPWPIRPALLSNNTPEVRIVEVWFVHEQPKSPDRT